MFSLHINNTEVALPETFDFGMVLENPMFNRRGNYSYPFNVPYEPNKALFGHIKELSAVEPTLPIDFEIKWSDVTKLAGTVSGFKYTDGQIELTLIGAKSAFYANFTGKHLDEIDMGSEDYTAMSAAQIEAKWVDSCKGSWGDINFPDYDQYPYTFAPFFAANFYSDDSLSTQKDKYNNEVINPWNPKTESFFYAPELPNGTILCMNLYFKYVIEKIIQHAGYTIGRNDLDLNGPGYFNFTSLDIKRLFFTSWTRLRPQWVEGKIFELNQVLPHQKITDFLDYLGTWIGMFIDANDTNKTVDIVLLTKVIQDDRIETRLNRETLIAQQERETFVLPGKTLQYTMDEDEFNGNLTEINPAEVIGTVNAFEDLPTLTPGVEGIIYKVNYGTRYFRWTEITPEIEEPPTPAVFEWKIVGEFAPITRGEDPEETDAGIKTHLTDVFPKTLPYPGSFIDEIFDLEIPFSSLSIGVDYNNIISGLEIKPEFDISILIYKGLWEFTNELETTILYPYASYDRNPRFGNIGSGWLSLKLIGLQSIDYNFQALPINWEINYKRPVSFYLDVPEGTVFNFDFLLKYLFNDLSFFINKIHINFKRQKISSVRLECYYASGGVAALPQHVLKIDDTFNLLIDEVHKLIID